MRRSTALVALCALLVCTLLPGCGAERASDGSGTVDTGATLRVGMPVVAQSLDPRQAPEPGQMLMSTWPVYDRLIQVGSDARYKPMLTTKWTFSPDGEALTLTLRHGVTFSDGAPFNANAVKANLRFYLSANNSTAQHNLSDVSGVDVLSDDTVRLRLARPSTTVLAALASELGGDMMSPKVLHGGNLATHPVGTGAYVIESFQPGQKVVYKRRSGGIWDTKTGKPATVVITAYRSNDATRNAIKSGQVDIVTWPGDKKPYQSELASGRLTSHIMSSVLNMVGVNFNRNVKPFDDVKVRQSVNYAINRAAVTKAFNPGGVAHTQPWPKGLPGYSKAREKAYPYNPARAKRLLAKAGYPHGVDGGEFLVAQAGNIPQAAQAVQANLAAVGIKIRLRTVDSLTLVTEWPKSGNPAEIMYMSTPSIDPYSWLRRLYVNPVWSPARPTHQITDLVQGVDDPKLSESDRASKVARAIDYATRNAQYAPLWQGVGGYVTAADVKGIDHPAGILGGVADFRWVSVTG